MNFSIFNFKKIGNIIIHYRKKCISSTKTFLHNLYIFKIFRKLIEIQFSNIQSIKYNWNYKIITIQDGILYTSSRLVGTSVEDSDVFPTPKVSDTIVEPYNATLSAHQNSLLVRASRDSSSLLFVFYPFII